MHAHALLIILSALLETDLALLRIKRVVTACHPCSSTQARDIPFRDLKKTSKPIHTGCGVGLIIIKISVIDEPN